MHHKALMLVVVAVTALALTGYIGASPRAESATVSKYQNDRANHHPVIPAE